MLTTCTCWWQGIENILKLGEEDKEKSGAEMNDFSRLVEEADGMDKLETLQSHANDEIYQRAVKILESYFGLEDEEVQGIQPQVAEDGSAFQFGGQGAGAPEGGFAGFGTSLLPLHVFGWWFSADWLTVLGQAERCSLKGREEHTHTHIHMHTCTAHMHTHHMRGASGWPHDCPCT